MYPQVGTSEGTLGNLKVVNRAGADSTHGAAGASAGDVDAIFGLPTKSLLAWLNFVM